MALKVTGRGGVPASDVSAVVLNVTVANPTFTGFITAHPGTVVPNASNLNFTAGKVVANQVTVKVGSDGIVHLQNSVGGTTHLIADVAGYFVAGTATSPGSFTALDPSRLLDTRNAPAVSIPANGSIDLKVTEVGGVAADAGAVALNVTVANPQADGFMTVYPKGEALPSASNLNFLVGQAIPNAVTVKVGTDGKITLKNSSAGSVDAIVDVNGFYKAGTATQSGMFVPLSPARILDSRSGTGMPKGDFNAGYARMFNNYETVALKVAGATPNIPSTNVSAVVMNMTIANATQAGFLTTFPQGTVRPQTSSVNFARWQVVPNLVTVKLGTTGAVNIYTMTAGQTNVVGDIAGYYIK